MKNLKKLIAALLAGIMMFSVAGCSGGKTSEPTNTAMNIATLKGPTGIGMVKLMEDNAGGTAANSYNFSLEAAPTDIVPLISTGAADIAACPLNVASLLYNKTNGGVQIIAINTLGVLYILEQGDTIHSVADLKGKTVYSSGQGASPEYILNFILSANGIDPKKDITVEYKTDHSELATLAASGSVIISMLPEPFVTTVLSKNAQTRKALNLTDEWVKACEKSGLESTLAMGCIVARKEYVQNNEAAVKAFLSEYKASVDYVHNNVPAAAALTAKYEIIADVNIAEKAIPNCNIVFIAGNDMKVITQQNLNVLFSANPSSVGGKEPGDDFYFGA